MKISAIIEAKEGDVMDQIKIGKFIADRRKRMGLTQAELAEALGLTDRAVSKWETGRSLPDPAIMLALCEILKINVYILQNINVTLNRLLYMILTHDC